VIEMLSEHTMQGFMQGYTLTGRSGLFPSYEAFLGIITTMMVQYAKFVKIAMSVPWRHPIPSLNYIESSTLWRQEHNGFSHQNPGFINSLINMKSSIARVYLPPDTNCLISTMNHALNSKNYINLIISSKNESNSWLNLEEAADHCRTGASIWKWAGNEEHGKIPDVVLACSGNEVTTETIAAAQLLKRHLPCLKTRVVNVTDLMILETEGLHPHGLSDDLFDALFTKDRPIIFNFHGYPSTVKQLMFERSNTKRITVLGYIEEGTTTTPFNMLVSNKASRFHVAIGAIKVVTPLNNEVAMRALSVIAEFQHQLRLHKEYIDKHNNDQPELADVMLTREQSKL